MATAKSKRPAAPPASAVLSAQISARIDAERRRLQKAGEVLSCLVFSVNHDADVDAADVASVACDLVERAVLELDPVVLKRGPQKQSAEG